jgi:hypothetical protein
MASPAEYLFPTSLNWKSNGELSDLEKRAITAKLMVSEQRPFTLLETKPMTYVALVADYTGRYAHVYGNANSWSNYVDQLEDIGCEVIENQTDDYEIDPSENLAECMEESGAIPIASLIKDTDFVPHV